MKPQRIEISYKTIVFTTVFLLSLYLLWQVRSLIYLVFFCFILMESLNPTVDRLERLKIPRAFAILFLYAIILTFFSFAIAGIVPILIEQTTALIKNLPSTIENLRFFGTSVIDLSSQFKIVESLPQNIAKTILSLFSNIFSGFVVFVITFYLLLERKNIGNYSFRLFGPQGKKKTLRVMNRLETRLGSWINAEIILMVAVGLLSYLGYLILGLNYTVPLAIIAGMLEIVPNIGPTISTLIAGLIGLTISPLVAILALIWGIVVQQVENNFLVPRVMKDAIGLNPLITILLLAAGAKLAGIGGAILAVPVYLTIETIVNVLSENSKTSPRN
ncbi:hypothetical protein A3K55_00590 [Candidatus Shapirobacteria bacterium RBG_13_44_7]|uniref:AI-2E family transporter n=1 Tax=Candidatus Shapirobacteria bacterium RBG_13_44_7 TaxID=1802149 RepID=A0A1F7SEQ9_9BACT|nr:MAG: hypothetical protein A3K55_00590 [Candidatus Shapirobacteria bacterium RBG_13_44_7]